MTENRETRGLPRRRWRDLPPACARRRGRPAVAARSNLPEDRNRNRRPARFLTVTRWVPRYTWSVMDPEVRAEFDELREAHRRAMERMDRADERMEVRSATSSHPQTGGSGNQPPPRGVNRVRILGIESSC